MNEVIKGLTDSPLRLGAAAASLAVLGYTIIKGIFYHGNEENKNRIYPPGPPQDLLFGNLRQYPKNKIWDTFCKWARQYGARPSIRVLFSI
jgi:hypothetical protein